LSPAALAGVSTRSIVSDALTRIPTAYFSDLAWARESVGTCTAMITEAAFGDFARMARWLDDARDAPNSRALPSVLHAVCDAIIADTVMSRGDLPGVSAFIASLEHDILGRLAADRHSKDETVMRQPQTLEFAAGLVALIRMHDIRTATHCEATAVLARRIAGAMQLPAAQVATIELAALVHDIGNVSVAKDILTRPGPLDADEWRAVHEHTHAGAALLAELPALAPLAPIVGAHHERLDGSGYPNGLRADEIPFEARVIAAADTFVALTTERPFRTAIMPGAALDVLAADAGTRFDADVIGAMLRMFDHRPASRRDIA